MPPLRPALLALALLANPAFPAADESVAPGTRLETLTAGATVYHHVQIRSINARTAIILHDGGLTSIRLRDLSPEWQARFHYDPAADEASERAVKLAPTPPPPILRGRARLPPPESESRFEKLLQEFGRPAILNPEVDLRPKFFQLELNVKNQGRRPSCAVFAIVSALEFQNAQLTGRTEKFSEEYLVWATRQTVARVTADASSGAESTDDADEGFTLGEVVSALRAYGIPRQRSMPNTLSRAMEAIEPPSPSIIEEARTHCRVFVHSVPGRDNATRINNLVHALNAGIPVATGMAWPNFRSLRTGYVSEQKPLPGAGHAVTIVGYKCATGRLEDAVFIFKNSWGIAWGQGGYGWVTFGYLDRNLGDAAVLEIQPGMQM